MKKTFKVYNECVTWVTIDIPEGATIDEVDDIVRNEFYDNPMLETENLDEEITDIEFENDKTGELYNLGKEDTHEHADIPFWEYFKE